MTAAIESSARFGGGGRGTTSDSFATSKNVRIPKGEGKRGEGIRTAERQPGQSCAADFYERRSEVDCEMLASHDGLLSCSLSECAFFMEEEDFVCDETSAATRSDSEGENPGDNSTREVSPHGVTTTTFCQRWSEDDNEIASRKGTPTPHQALASVRAEEAVSSGRAC
jgi:hypothetical protein